MRKLLVLPLLLAMSACVISSPARRPSSIIDVTPAFEQPIFGEKDQLVPVNLTFRATGDDELFMVQRQKGEVNAEWISSDTTVFEALGYPINKGAPWPGTA